MTRPVVYLDVDGAPNSLLNKGANTDYLINAG